MFQLGPALARIEGGGRIVAREVFGLTYRWPLLLGPPFPRADFAAPVDGPCMLYMLGNKKETVRQGGHFVGEISAFQNATGEHT